MYLFGTFCFAFLSTVRPKSIHQIRSVIAVSTAPHQQSNDNIMHNRTFRKGRKCVFIQLIAETMQLEAIKLDV